MNECKLITLKLLRLVVVVLTFSVFGFGQTKFFTVDNPIPNRYIAVLDSSPYNGESRPAIESVAQDLATSYNGTVGFTYDNALYGFSVEMSEEDAIALSEDPQVEYVIQDNEMYMSDTQPNAPWNLDRLDQRDLPLSTTYTYSTNGAGTMVYVIDSGINRTHIEFGGLSTRATIGADFVGGNGTDCNGHGTHVAGIAGGTTYGVAKGIFLTAVRVFGCTASSPTSTIIAGVNWVRANHVTRSVANMSLGGGVNQALDDAVRNLVASGVTCVVAAGNDNADANNTSPARVRQAITVGAVDINDARASFSNFGTAVDVFAPGVNVTSAWWDGGYNTISGTSMAAPHVAGVAAQVLTTYQTNPIPLPSQIQDIVVANASWQKVSNRGTGSPNDLLYNAAFTYGDTLKPLYRYWRPPAQGADHLYANTWSEVGAGSFGYTVEGIAGFVYSSPVPGTVPLYRYWNLAATDHLYTADFSELGNGANGYVLEQTIGYVWDTEQSGRLPLYRYFSSSNTDHFYTTNFSELGYGANGYVYEGITCYLPE